MSKHMQNFIKSMRDVGSNAYVCIPEEAPANHKQEELLEASKDAPHLRWRRDEKIAYNEHFCVLKAAASCLYYLGYRQLAHVLCNDLDRGHKLDFGFELFQTMLHPQKLKKEHGERKLQLCKLKPHHVKTWDIFEDSKNYLMCLVGLHGSDGKKDHAITIAGQWIFDFNLEHALPLTRESLDLCCLDVSQKTFIWVSPMDAC